MTFIILFTATDEAYVNVKDTKKLISDEDEALSTVSFVYVLLYYISFLGKLYFVISKKKSNKLNSLRYHNFSYIDIILLL